MSIQLIAIDLDGTLLSSTKRISEPTLAALCEARLREGVRIVLASARPPRTTLPFYKQLELTGPMSNYNGALVLHPPSNRILLHRPIPAKTARKAVQLARKIAPDVFVSAEILDRWYTDRFDERYFRKDFMTETAKLCKPDVIAPMHTWLNRAVTKLLIPGRSAMLDMIAAAIRMEFPKGLTIVQTQRYLLQIMHSMASKALSLQAVAAELGVDRQNVMAIGDNANDTGMLQWAGIGVAMANANEYALAAADYVTDHNDSHGVAKAVRKAVLEGKPPGRKT